MYIGKEPIVGNFQKCDALTASGTADYTLQVSSTNVVPESANHMLVSLNGILQAPITSFTVSGSTLSFASALTSSDSIDFVMLLGNVLDIGTPSDATITNAKLVSGSFSNITTTGTLTGFTSTGIDDNADALAVTIDSNEKVGIGTATPGSYYSDKLVIDIGSAAQDGITIKSDTDKDGMISFADGTSGNARYEGYILYDHDTNYMALATSASEAMRIDANGHIIMPKQPAVHAYASSTQDNIATGIVTINLNAEVYDVNSDFNTGTYTFTAPVTGKYMMCAALDTSDIDTANQGVSLLMVASNRNYYFDEIDPRIEMSADGKHTWSGSSLVDMDANDTLIMKTRSTAHGAAQHNIVTGQTWMTVHLAC
jgi:hypothetical protein